MSLRELKILALVAAVMLGLAIGVYQQQYAAGTDDYLGTRWLSDLDINAVSRMDIVGPGDTEPVSLERRAQSGWGVVQRNHYPAQIGLIRAVLVELEAARLFERKTNDPAQHVQLGLGRIDQAQAQGHQLTIHLEDGGVRTVRLGTRPDGRNATYVRLGNEDQVWLVDRVFTIPQEARRWLETELLDLGMADMHGLTITHADGEEIRAQRAEDGAERFDPLNLPQGATLKNEYALSRAASAVTNLSLEDVMLAVEAETYLRDTPQILYDMYAGYRLEARMFARGEERYASFTVRIKDGASEAYREQAEQLSLRLKPWAFRIPSFAYDSMSLRWDDVLQAPESLPASE